MKNRIWTIVWLLLLGWTVFVGGKGGRFRIYDPYAAAQGSWYRGQVHAHSTTHQYFVHEDSLRDKVERYRDAGYDFVCMTDHNQVSRVASVPRFPLPTRDPGVPGIHFISGAEIGFGLGTNSGDKPRKHHIGAIGMDWSVEKGDSLFRLAETDLSKLQAAIDSIRTRFYAHGKSALAVLNHPEMEALADTRFYPSDLLGVRRQSGIEVYNAKWARSSPHSRTWQSHGASHWDFLLSRGSGVRWGFATDDAHAYEFGEDFLAGWILVRAKELTTEALLDAVRAGQFVACVDSCEGATRDTTSAKFTELAARGSTIVAATDRPGEFTWWMRDGHLARTTRGALADTFRVQGDEGYLRVRLRNEDGAAYSQPFFLENPARDAERWKLRKELGTKLLYHFDEGVGEFVREATGSGFDLRIRRGTIPPVETWTTREDTTCWRDSLWGGWMHNGAGTTPDEVDVDRDRSGYALRAHGRDFSGEISSGGKGPFLWRAPWTVEFVGTLRRATPSPQPLLTVPGEEGSPLVRLVVEPEDAPAAFRLSLQTTGGERSFAFGAWAAGSPPLLGEAHLVAVTVEDDRQGVRVRGYIGGELAGDSLWTGVRSIGAAKSSGPIFLLGEPEIADPLLEPQDGPFVYFALRELRLTKRARRAEEILDDARRLELINVP